MTKIERLKASKNNNATSWQAANEMLLNRKELYKKQFRCLDLDLEEARNKVQRLKTDYEAMVRTNVLLERTHKTVKEKAEDSWREKTKEIEWLEAENDELNIEIVVLKVKLDRTKSRLAEELKNVTQTEETLLLEETPTIFQKIGHAFINMYESGTGTLQNWMPSWIC